MSPVEVLPPPERDEDDTVDGVAHVSGVGITGVLVDGGVVVVEDDGLDEPGAAEVVGEFAGRVTGGTIGIDVTTGCGVGSAAAPSPDNDSAAVSDSTGTTTDVDAATADGRSAESVVASTPASFAASFVTDSERVTVELLAAVAPADSVVELAVATAALLPLTASRDV